MSFETERLTELVTGELMQFKGRGVDYKRRTQPPRLSKLAQVEPDLDPVTSGSIIRHYLEAAIESLPDRLYDFEGKRHPVNKVQAAFYLDLCIGATGKHRRRCERLIALLGLGCTYDRWRKDPQLERGFLRILAEHMVRQSTLQDV